MDERFNKMYQSEQRIGKIIGTFSFLAILIACIGLIGLATFMAQQRTKEIGVRKVLGASTAGLVGLLSPDFLKLVFIAFLIAIPLVWMAMHKWLHAYRINIEWWVFALAGMGALLMAFATVSIQSIRAAMANPVKSLRSE